MDGGGGDGGGGSCYSGSCVHLVLQRERLIFGQVFMRLWSFYHPLSF